MHADVSNLNPQSSTLNPKSQTLDACVRTCRERGVLTTDALEAQRPQQKRTVFGAAATALSAPLTPISRGAVLLCSWGATVAGRWPDIRILLADLQQAK